VTHYLAHRNRIIVAGESYNGLFLKEMGIAELDSFALHNEFAIILQRTKRICPQEQES
jgi:hypothetical protein